VLHNTIIENVSITCFADVPVVNSFFEISLSRVADTSLPYVMNASFKPVVATGNGM